MHKTRLYILQGLGIIMLIFGYFLSDKPDNKSVMHFNLHGNHVFTSAPDDDNDVQYTAATSLSEHKGHHHKVRAVKFFSFKLTTPIPTLSYQYMPLVSVDYIIPLNERYYFLFCKEINPPPPKAC